MINIKDHRFLEVLPDRAYMFFDINGQIELAETIAEVHWQTRVMLCCKCAENHIVKAAEQTSGILEDFGWCNDCEKSGQSISIDRIGFWHRKERK